MSSTGTARDAPKARSTERTRIEEALLIKDALPENTRVFASGGVRLNGRELRFGEARLTSAQCYAEEQVQSVM